MRTTGLLAVLGLVVGTGGVQAADLLPIPDLDPPLTATNPFEGFYAGAQVGYGWGEFPNSAANVAAGLGFAVTNGLGDADGFLGGVHAGYNVAYEQVLFGLEAEINLSSIDDGLNIAGVVPGSADLEYFGIVAARVGLTPTDNLLAYLKGGFAFGRADVDLNTTAIGGGNVGDSEFHTGWMIGGGVEYAIFDGFTVRGEYNYIDLGSESYNLGLGTPVSAGFEGHLVKLGVSAYF